VSGETPTPARNCKIAMLKAHFLKIITQSCAVD
jgi:hypothetical protein